MNIRGHFDTITHHKLLVMKYCFACGLYRQGLTHDLSKYSPTDARPEATRRRGSTTRAATGTIWNTGSTTAWARAASRG